MFMVNGFLDELSPAERAQLQDLVEQFEAKWRSGKAPALVDYLPTPGSLRRADPSAKMARPRTTELCKWAMALKMHFRT